MIFAIDGAEDFGFGELGAYSSGVASLQTALIALGQKVGDSTLASLVLDGLIGPKTTAAANRAFTTFVSNSPNFASNGTMSQSQVASAAEELASFVKSEVSRRGGSVSSTAVARVPAGAVAPTQVSDTSASIVKYAAIGLGGVIVASLLYWMYRRSQGRPVFGGGCDFGAAGIDDHVRAQWVDNDPYLRKLYQNQSYPLRQFVKRQRAHIDARILDARDGFGASKLGPGEMRPYSYYEVKKMAENQWPDLWSLEEVDTPPGSVIRRIEGRMGKYRGQAIAQQFKARLHSSTGPLHWIVVREDGTPMFDGARSGKRRRR